MLIVNSHNNRPVRLTIERWKHITRRHPEMESQREKVLETITEAELIQKGDFGELIAFRFYDRSPLSSKYLAVVYKEVTDSDGFVITAYYTSKPSDRRRTIWKR